MGNHCPVQAVQQHTLEYHQESEDVLPKMNSRHPGGQSPDNGGNPRITLFVSLLQHAEDSRHADFLGIILEIDNTVDIIQLPLVGNAFLITVI
ncbi:hypothetical protein D3C75_682630 [compost metagenome]